MDASADENQKEKWKMRNDRKMIKHELLALRELSDEEWIEFLAEELNDLRAEYWYLQYLYDEEKEDLG